MVDIKKSENSRMSNTNLTRKKGVNSGAPEG